MTSPDEVPRCRGDYDESDNDQTRIFVSPMKCPDVEGITTWMVCWTSGLLTPMKCPDVEGITTYPLGKCIRHDSPMKCPDVEGITTEWCGIWSW